LLVDPVEERGLEIRTGDGMKSEPISDALSG